jgi:hypothetical protein
MRLLQFYGIMKGKPMQTRFFIDTRRLTRAEVRRLKQMTPEQRRKAAADALAGLELDSTTRARVTRAWQKP